MKPRLVLSALSALAALGLLAGCGGEGSSSGADPVDVAPAGAVLYIEGVVQPAGKLKLNVEAVVEKVSGKEDLVGYYIGLAEVSANEGTEPFDFEKEIQPWLGERIGFAFRRFDGDEPTGGVAAVQTTAPDATAEFVDGHANLLLETSRSDDVEDKSYEGVDYKLDSDGGDVVGIVGDLLVFSEEEKDFKAAVDASAGDSLGDEDRYQQAIEGSTEGSLADVYVDVGGLLDASGDEIDPQARQVLEGAGIDPSDATAVASVVPGSDTVEIDISSDLAGEEPPSGDPSKLLGTLPADSFAAFGVAGFGEQLREAVDSLDESGIPGEIPPNKLKSSLKEAGVDLDQISGSIEDAGVFAQGASENALGGALVLTTDESKQAANTVSNIGLLLRASNTPGVTAVTGKASGFSVRDEELGRKPLVVVAKGDRIAIAYGLPAALQGVAGGGKTLSALPAYKEAVASLGGTPIAAFVDGPAALALAKALVPKSEEGFGQAVPYLGKIASLALGSSSEGDLATAKLIVGLEK